ncbi:hypothetical protein BGZ60DRAFT_110650 [Tricladium varicosporioides]|nr:hypothetical protein BGZ60DRAFT_110650 [Hymenoscyphus varicosporioides]
MANLRFWFTYLLHTLQLVAAQSTVQRNFGDGSYCLHCSASNALDALGCDLAFVFSGCFFGALLGDLGTCGVPSYSSASGKSCYSLGSCATSCTGADASGYYLDYCCFLPGSPFITPYLAGTTPPTPSPTKSTVPTPTASSKGITCNIVDTLANEYAAAAAGGPDALGYYGQVLNLACLRSTCINPACQRVASVRSTDPECANLGGSFDFEQAVFGKFTQNVDLNKVTHDAGKNFW